MLRLKYPVLLLSLTFLAYAFALRGQFLWDDEMLVGFFSNFHAQSIWNIFDTRLFEVRNYFRPLVTLTYAVDYAIWGLDSFGFHLSNLLFHGLAVLSLYGLFKNRFSESAAFWVAALWAVHPVNVEAVGPCFSRCCELEALWITALFVFSRARPLRFEGWTVSALFFLSLLSKESAVVFPAIATLYWWLFLARSESATQRNRWRVLLPLWAIAIAFVLIRLTFIPIGQTRVLSLIADQPWPVRVWTFFESIIQYLGLIIFPLHLHMERHFVSSFFSPWPVLGLFLLCLGMAWGWRLRQKTPDVAFGLLWFLITLAPTANLLIPLPMTISERWLYLPSIGLFWILAAFVSRVRAPLPNRRLAFALGLLVALFAVRTAIRSMDWRDGATLYAHDLQESPNSFLLHTNLGVVDFREGRFEQAKSHFQRAIEIQPRYGVAMNNLGAIFEREGDLEKAQDAYGKAIVASEYPLAYSNLAKILLRRNQPDAARRVLEEGRAKNPFDPGILTLLQQN